MTKESRTTSSPKVSQALFRLYNPVEPLPKSKRRMKVEIVQRFVQQFHWRGYKKKLLVELAKVEKMDIADIESKTGSENGNALMYCTRKELKKVKYKKSKVSVTIQSIRTGRNGSKRFFQLALLHNNLSTASLKT